MDFSLDPNDMKNSSKRNDKLIYEIFNHRCIICWERATEINEIIPRSRTKKAFDLKNCVPLCHQHHRIYHENGVTPEKIKDMQDTRAMFLRILGKSEYI